VPAYLRDSARPREFWLPLLTARRTQAYVS